MLHVYSRGPGLPPKLIQARCSLQSLANWELLPTQTLVKHAKTLQEKLHGLSTGNFSHHIFSIIFHKSQCLPYQGSLNYGRVTLHRTAWNSILHAESQTSPTWAPALEAISLMPWCTGFVFSRADGKVQFLPVPQFLQTKIRATSKSTSNTCINTFCTSHLIRKLHLDVHNCTCIYPCRHLCASEYIYKHVHTSIYSIHINIYVYIYICDTPWKVYRFFVVLWWAKDKCKHTCLSSCWPCLFSSEVTCCRKADNHWGLFSLI